MARQKGTANFSGTLEVLAGGPIDSRTVVPTLADLTVASNFPYAYVGMETYVVSENKKYRLIAADVTQSSNWEEVGSGGGGGGIDVDDALSSTSENPVQNKVVKAALDSKVNAVNGKGLSTNDYTTEEKNKLAGLSNYDDTALRGLIADKQDQLTAGNGIYITNNVISAGIPIVANQFDKANIYSTTEKVVGMWTDGRPIYQKTFEVTPGSATTYDIATITNLKKLISATGWAENTADHVYRWDIPNTNSADTRNTEYLFAIDNVLKINKPAAGATYHVTAQYTKTTDAANSFKYADENDYSTTEHIVGSWIDGKPIYQKCITGIIAANGTATVVPNILIPNIDAMVSDRFLGKHNSLTYIELPITFAGKTRLSYVRTGASPNHSSYPLTYTITNGFTDASVTYCLILQYTKTTD